jgi:hypothetical protein
MRTSDSYTPIFISYAGVVVASALALATHDALTFKPGGEFGSPAGIFAFMLIVLGGFMLILGALPLALAVAFLSTFGRPVRLPALVGALYGIVFVFGSGTGGVPVVAGFVALALLAPLLLVLARRRRAEATPGT